MTLKGLPKGNCGYFMQVHCWGQEGSTSFICTATPRVGCVVWRPEGKITWFTRVNDQSATELVMCTPGQTNMVQYGLVRINGTQGIAVHEFKYIVDDQFLDT